MHCPTCGQQQISDETRFCSRCGFLLTGIAQVVANGGVIRQPRNNFVGEPDSPKRRGVKQGAFLFFLAFLVVPILLVTSIGLGLGPIATMIGLFLLVGGGLLRAVYALMFESGTSVTGSTDPAVLMPGADQRPSLPSGQSIPVSVYAKPTAGSWRDTNDLQAGPGSVTDHTTKLLQNEGDPQ